MDAVFTIDQLASESGLPSRTIRFYAQEKLLPPPDSFKGRTALYSGHHLEILKLIKSLKEKRFMPLSVIKEVIEDPQKLENLYDGLKVNEEIFNMLGYQPPTLDSKQMIQYANLTEKELNELEELKFIHPSFTDGRKQYSSTDLNIAKLVKKLLTLGLKLDEIKILPDLLSQLSRTAVSLIHDRFHEELTMDPEKCIAKLEPIIEINKELTMLLYQQLIQEAAKEHILEDLQNGCCLEENTMKRGE